MAGKASSGKSRIGSWSFLLGTLVAILAGVTSQGDLRTSTISLLIIFGIVVGLLNVTRKETTPFLLATVALIIVTSFGGETLGEFAGIGLYLEGVLAAIITFVVPAAIIVALKAIYSIAED